MDRIVRLTSFEEQETERPQLRYWQSRTPEERLSEVERLRREYMAAIRGASENGISQRLCRSLLIVERQSR